ncbi:RHS repeat domain-containing protein [Flavobacterium sp. NRK1]|uniref:RHS repeat domain-containing protein n=1 Tax=Flavobacterium sp. NRK1 TaxID=2954929 RepID=UPI002093ABE3|nr:RHS repeat domain-containing protein [Flavobacterium sp. NRK1]MCO6149642.1 RHS repeat protein [Flavobacterium sp. NRK1]
MSTVALKTELVKLYTDFPSNKVIIELYDASGKLVTLIDQRRNETNYIYDEFGRIQHITDKSGNIIESKIYNYGN